MYNIHLNGKKTLVLEAKILRFEDIAKILVVGIITKIFFKQVIIIEIKVIKIKAIF